MELLVFSILITGVLTVGVIFCLFAKTPFIRHRVSWYMNARHEGVYIININKFISYLFSITADDLV